MRFAECVHNAGCQRLPRAKIDAHDDFQIDAVHQISVVNPSIFQRDVAGMRCNISTKYSKCMFLYSVSFDEFLTFVGRFYLVHFYQRRLNDCSDYTDQ